MAAIKAYRPAVNSLSTSQVLQEPYTFAKARVVAREMADGVALDLVDKRLVADQLTLTVGYDTECLTRREVAERYHGEVVTDWYGRSVPRPAHGTARLPEPTSSSSVIIDAIVSLFERLVDPLLLVRRITIGTYHVVPEAEAAKPQPRQLDLFTDYEAAERRRREEERLAKRERTIQEVTLSIKKKFGKNALLRGTDFDEGATARERNRQIGGHHE